MLAGGKVRFIGRVAGPASVVIVKGDDGVVLSYISKELIVTEYAVFCVNPVKVTSLGGPADSVTLIPF